MSRRQRINDLLSAAFRPLFLEVVDESHMHSVREDAQSHFRVVVVTEQFEGSKSIERQRQVNRLLADEFNNGLHALALHTWTPQQWFDRGGASPESPPCMGGSKSN